MLQEVSLGIAEAESTADAYRFALSAIVRHMDWALGHVYFRDQEGERLTSSDIWYPEDVGQFAHFKRTTQEVSVGEPGTLAMLAFETARPVLVGDLHQEPRFIRGRYLNQLDFHSYFAFPIVVNGRVVAVLEFFSRQPGRVPHDILEVIGNLSAQLGVSHKRHQAEDALRASEARFRAIFNRTLQFIGLMKPDGTLLEANDTALDFAGLTLADVVDRPFWETAWWNYSEAVQDQLKDDIRRAAAGEYIRHDAVVMGLGGPATIDFSIRPLYDDAGEVTLLLPEARDVTSEKEAVAKLRASENLLAEAQHIAHVGHWEYVLSSGKIYWSDELFRIWGRERAEEVDFDEIMHQVHPDDVQFVESKVNEVAQSGGSYDIFNRIIRPDGMVRVIHARGQAVKDESGEVVAIHGTAQDRTDEREKEIALAQTIRQLSTLNRLSQAIAASLELPVIYARVLSQVRPLLDAEAVLIFSYVNDELVVTAADESGVGNLVGMRFPADKSVVGEVWRTGRSIFLTGDECARRVAPLLSETADFQPRSLMTVPISWQGQHLGALEALSREEDAFSREDLSLLETVASWTAIAIGKARQYDELQRRLRETEGIAAVSQALIELLDVPHVLDTVVRVTRQMLPLVSWSWIELLEGNPERLELAASSGPDGAGGSVPAVDPNLLMEVIVQGRPAQIRHTDAYGRMTGVLVAPVQSRSRRIGVLCVACEDLECFPDDDGQLLHVLGVQTGMAIDNARLYEEQRRARVLAEQRRERILRLAQRVVSAQEDERLRISRELHDEAGQALTSLKISLSLVRDSLPADLSDARRDLTELMSITDETMRNLRLLSHNLRPPGIDEYGLEAVLSGLCHDFTTRTRVPVTFQQTPELPPLTPLVSLSLYRFVQEALTNAAKHADATRVDVMLNTAGDEIVLSVTDDGRGFEPGADGETSVGRRGVGLINMAERLEMINGHLEVHSEPSRGTSVVATVPLQGML